MGKMTGCDDCFYAQKDEEEFPCNMCKGYLYYLHKDVYKEETDNKAWAKVVEGLSGLSKEDFNDGFYGGSEDYVKGDPHFYAGGYQLWPSAFELKQEHYDSVSKPKHYMLFDFDDVVAFEGKGIEVRDVIEKLVDKIKGAPSPQVPLWETSPMFESDYVQMMQYLMRFMDKNGVEDLKKARWYLDKLIQSYHDAESY
jgi:hypothetical protein